MASAKCQVTRVASGPLPISTCTAVIVVQCIVVICHMSYVIVVTCIAVIANSYV